MYIDRPRPNGSALAAPVCIGLFFAIDGLVLGTLVVRFLPPELWMFAAPVLFVCLAVAAAAGWYAVMLGRIEYRIGGGMLEIRAYRRVWSFPLEGIRDLLLDDASFDPSTLGAGLDTSERGGRRSARRFANRAAGIFINAGGEWLRLSPSDPQHFAHELIAARDARAMQPPPGSWIDPELR
ncbi:MAG: hypothetical protein HYX52_01960 [Chloroflexi bacterium]|nr:hypothetical protein [Chloroflexota bacterium]